MTSDPTPDPILSPDTVAKMRAGFATDRTARKVVTDLADSHEALRAERDNLALAVEEDAIYLRAAEGALEAETRRTGGIEDELEYVYTVLSDETRRADEAEKLLRELVDAGELIDRLTDTASVREYTEAVLARDEIEARARQVLGIEANDE